MPGMIDTHRHMWQTAMRGYGADWTLTQYFVWYYLESGKHFRPEDVRRQPARRARGRRRRRDHVRRLVARPADHRPRRGGRRRAARGARPLRARLRQRPAGPWEWSTSKDFQAFARRRSTRPTTCSASRWPSTSPATRRSPGAPPSRSRASWASPSPPVGVWGATNDDGIRLPHEAGFFDETTTFVHATTLSTDSYQRIAAPPAAPSRGHESEQSAGRATRPPGGCARTASRCRCRWTPACGGAATCSPPCAAR